MKTLLQLLLLCLLAQTTFAQNWLITGNSGTTPPTNFIGTIDNKALVIKTHNAERMRIDKSGNVGIGTSTPAVKLDVEGGNVLVNGTIQSMSGGFIFPDGTTQTTASPWTKTGSNLYLTTGSVVIGTTVTPTYALEVCGGIRAKEMHVSTTWCDYVFEKNYSLRPLPELESYVEKNKHLPDIPSADEVAANGIEVGQMSSAMMKKIEELTLYVIDLQKQVDDLKQKLTNDHH